MDLMHTRSTKTIAQAGILFSMWGAAPAVGARFDREDRASAVEILLDKTKAERQTCQDACGIFFPASELKLSLSRRFYRYGRRKQNHRQHCRQ